MSKAIFTLEGNVLRVERNFAAPLELVWKAWTKAELLDQWWAPKPWKSVTQYMNFQVGGVRLYAMVGPNQEEHWCVTSYHSIKVHQSFTGEDAFSDKEGNVNKDFPVAKFTNTFEWDGTDTKVVITTAYASEEALKQILEMGMEQGLSMAFENLDEVLSEA